ncbi:YqaJ viral recombinase family protein [Puerhibacterium puerhi]|uniref:YqaJ viral recombinase family protein n=1 Tax=Puerhibacterium puerhi TaxID=2692623 RepID=UPI00135C0386|nr:YqaJ viral recombinase family protein [Puerhibacterium puerhi]
MSVSTQDVDLTPGSEAWSKLVSGSKVAAILGVSPWSSPLATWLEMKGRVPREEVTTDSQSRGTYLEPSILAWWRDRHPDLLDYEEQVTVPFEDWGIATLDALALTTDFERIGAEAKSTAKWDGWGKEGTDEIPPYYLAQVDWQMLCQTDLARVYVPVIGPFLDFREYVVERDTSRLEELEARVREFRALLDSDVEPPLDDHPATLSALKRLNDSIIEGKVEIIPEQLAQEFITADDAFKAAESRLVAAKSAITKLAGKSQYIDTHYYEPGRKEPRTLRVARRQRQGRGVPYLVRQARKWPGV